MVLKACSRCGKIHGYGECKVPAKDFKLYNKSSINKFRSKSTWQRKRNEIIKRDAYLCKLCLYNGVLNNKNLEVHHIIPIKDNDDLKLVDNNLITLCRSCHDLVEKEKRYRSLLTQLANMPPESLIR